MSIRSPSPGVPSVYSFHKCVEDWLEFTATGRNCSGDMVSGRTVYQHLGGKGSSVGFEHL